jgi:hypothetical protein
VGERRGLGGGGGRGGRGRGGTGLGLVVVVEESVAGRVQFQEILLAVIVPALVIRCPDPRVPPGVLLRPPLRPPTACAVAAGGGRRLGAPGMAPGVSWMVHLRGGGVGRSFVQPGLGVDVAVQGGGGDWRDGGSERGGRGVRRRGSAEMMGLPVHRVHGEKCSFLPC